MLIFKKTWFFLFFCNTKDMFILLNGGNKKMNECSSTVSFWHRTAQEPAYPKLEKDAITDTLIIGGGITGVACAYRLAQQGMHSILIESGRLCGGTTGNANGKLTMQHGVAYGKLIKALGFDRAFSYAASQNEALDFVRHTVAKHAIDCGIADETAYVFAANESERKAVMDESHAAHELGIDAEFVPTPSFPGSLCMCGYKKQLSLHPVNFVQSLAKIAADEGISIYENTKAESVREGQDIVVTCAGGVNIHARHLIIATQYPIYEGLGIYYFSRLYPVRIYSMAVEPKKDWPQGMYINAGSPSKSISSYNDQGKRIMIVSGESHFTGRGMDCNAHFERLSAFALQLAGMKNILSKWSAQDYETPDGLPYIGRMNEKSNIFTACGFGRWGMSNGICAAILITDEIIFGKSKYGVLFSPNRKDVIHSPLKYMFEISSSVGELIKSKVELPESIAGMQSGEGRVINFRGKRAGIFLDGNGGVTILDISCSHMTTGLNFNSAEKSWDCPAHGSRFTTDGQPIEGPGKRPLPLLYKGSIGSLTNHSGK